MATPEQGSDHNSGSGPASTSDPASTRLDRKDVASWISGPGAALGEAGIDLGYRGERLGLPETGVGSVAGFGRRLVALCIDWIACALVATLIFPQYVYGSPRSALNTIIVFFVVKSLFTWLGGATAGQRLMGTRVISINGGKGGVVQPWWALLRTFMVCLVIPAVIWNRDGRGLQDLVCKTVEVRSR